MRSARILVFGPQGVGKSTLCHRYLAGTYVEDMDPTVSAGDVKVLSLAEGEEQLKVEVEDAAPSDRYDAWAYVRFKEAEGLLLVCSLADRRTVEEAEQLWREFHTRRGEEPTPGKIPCLLVGNKSDLEAERQVPANRLAELAAKLGTEAIETSAKHNGNVERAFVTLTKMIVDRTEKGKEKEKERGCLLS